MRWVEGAEVEVDCWQVAAIPQVEGRRQGPRTFERQAVFRSFRRTQSWAHLPRHNVGKSSRSSQVTLNLQDEFENQSWSASGTAARFRLRGLQWRMRG